MTCGDSVVIQTLVQVPALPQASTVTQGGSFGSAEVHHPHLEAMVTITCNSGGRKDEMWRCLYSSWHKELLNEC